MASGKVQQDWGYPALFNTPGKDCWYLIHEADLDENYCEQSCPMLLKKQSISSPFLINGTDVKKGESQPKITLEIVVAGNYSRSLADIVESTLVDDVCPPSIIAKLIGLNQA